MDGIFKIHQNAGDMEKARAMVLFIEFGMFRSDPLNRRPLTLRQMLDRTVPSIEELFGDHPLRAQDHAALRPGFTPRVAM